MQPIDISMRIRQGMPVYPGDPAFQIEQISKVVAGDPMSYALSRIALATHCGTHVDAPAHFIPGGATIETVALELLYGPARVLDLCRAPRAIDAPSLAARDLQGVERLLLKTEVGEVGSTRPLDESAHLTPAAATYLREQTTIRLIGIDTLSIEGASSEQFEVHRTLLSGDSPIIIIEGLALAEVEAGDYELTCLPLKIEGADGAPARAFLR